MTSASATVQTSRVRGVWAYISRLYRDWVKVYIETCMETSWVLYFSTKYEGISVIQTVRRKILTMEPWVQAQVTSYTIYGGRSVIGEHFSLEFLQFPPVSHLSTIGPLRSAVAMTRQIIIISRSLRLRIYLWPSTATFTLRGIFTLGSSSNHLVLKCKHGINPPEH
jgi:hypothetical protein